MAATQSRSPAYSNFFLARAPPEQRTNAVRRVFFFSSSFRMPASAVTSDSPPAGQALTSALPSSRATAS
jgi:hypothetical protein